MVSNQYTETIKIKCKICGYSAPRIALEDSTMYDMEDGTFRCSSCWIGKEQEKIIDLLSN